MVNTKTEIVTVLVIVFLAAIINLRGGDFVFAFSLREHGPPWLRKAQWREQEAAGCLSLAV